MVMTMVMTEEPETLSDGTLFTPTIDGGQTKELYGTFAEFKKAFFDGLAEFMYPPAGSMFDGFEEKREADIKLAEEQIAKKKAEALEAKIKAETEAAKLKQLEMEKAKTKTNTETVNVEEKAK